MAVYDVVIKIKGRTIIGETTHSLAQARKRFRWEQQRNDGRIVEIVKDGGLIESTDPEEAEYLAYTK